MRPLERFVFKGLVAAGEGNAFGGKYKLILQRFRVHRAYLIIAGVRVFIAFVGPVDALRAGVPVKGAARLQRLRQAGVLLFGLGEDGRGEKRKAKSGKQKAAEDQMLHVIGF